MNTEPHPTSDIPHPPSSGGDYRVQLDAYAGPMDLLLYLVKRHEIDLHDIPIAELTDQYLRHLAVIEAIAPGIDVERAGEFLVMAATLLEIKSRMIMPPPEAGAEGAEGEAAVEGDIVVGGESRDPRFELVQQLLAYKRYKDAAIELELRHDEWMRRYAAAPRKAGGLEVPQPKELDLDDVHVMDLCEAFARLLDSIGKTGHAVMYDDTPISLHAADIRDRLQREGALTLHQVFAGRRNRAEMIGLFLATLELVRDRVVRVKQERVGGDIQLELIPEDEPAAPEVIVAANGDEESRYDWPDPEAREAAQQRAARRAERLAKVRSGEAVDATEEDEDRFDELEAPSVEDMLEDIE